MIAKVIAWGRDRPTALARLDRALAGNVVLGLQTNGSFLRALLRDPDVWAGRLDTGLVERRIDQLVAGEEPRELLAAYAMSRVLAAESGTDDPWDRVDGWRLGEPADTVWRVRTSGAVDTVLRARWTRGEVELKIGDDPPLPGHATGTAARFLMSWGDRTIHVDAVVEGDVTWLWLDGGAYWVSERPHQRRSAAASHVDGDVRSPMPGTVVAVTARVGETVTRGQPLLVVEAMKMEHALLAPMDGVVIELSAAVGRLVALDALLARLEPSPASESGEPAPTEREPL